MQLLIWHLTCKRFLRIILNVIERNMTSGTTFMTRRIHEVKPPLQIVVAVEKTRRRTQGESNQHKLTLASTSISYACGRLVFTHAFVTQKLKPFQNNIFLATIELLRHWDCNANNKPLLQQRSLETANLKIAYPWRRKTITQPRNTRHSLAGSVSELQNSEAFTGDTSSLSLPPLCCFCSCPY